MVKLIELEKNNKAPYSGVLISNKEAELFITLMDKYEYLKDGFNDYLNGGNF